MNNDRMAKILDDIWSRQRFVEEFLQRPPREPDIEREIGEKAYQWQYVTREWPEYLVLGVNSFLKLYDVYRDFLPLGHVPGHHGKYHGMTIVIIPVGDFVEVSSGCDWSTAHYVRGARPHMGKKETENEDDETGVSEGSGGLCPDDGDPQGESWEGPAIFPSSSGA